MESTKMSGPMQPFTLQESLYAPLSQRFNNRKDSFLLSRTITIRRPIEEVFDVIMRPQIWTSCYPETVAVGGTTKRPIKKGDLVLEKFLFNGLYYSMFRYDVEILDRPTAARFHGIQVQSNVIVEKLLGNTLRELGGTFDYKFRKIDDNTTEWVRDLHLYTTSDTWAGKIMFKLFLKWLIGSQEKGATLFVHCAKSLLESPTEDYQRELFA
jgi:hypothetical protein